MENAEICIIIICTIKNVIVFGYVARDFNKNKYADAVHFSKRQNDNLSVMYALVENALLVMDGNLTDYDHADLRAANTAELEVNACRDRLRQEHLDALRHNLYGYEVGNAYSSLYAQYEKLADYVINVSQSVRSFS